MAPLTDNDRLCAYKDALSNWSFHGYVRYELTETAHRWLRSEFDGVTVKELGRLMFEYIENGGVIDEVKETRPEWGEFEYHYDMRFRIQGKPIYVETRLFHQPPFEPDESSVLVVNVHAP